MRTLTVARRTEINADVVLLDLVQAGGAPLPTWAPGAHIDVSLDARTVRQYSLCGDPADTHTWTIAVQRETDGRGGSRLIHETFHEGVAIQAGGPRNSFELVEADRYLFIVGGIGITPILPMIAAVQRRGLPWELHYGGRTRASMVMVEELLALDPRSVKIVPEDEEGRLDCAAILTPVRPSTAVYACGPAGMLDAVELASREWPENLVHMERFQGRRFEDMDEAAQRPCALRLSASGLSTVVEPTESVLDAVERLGIEILSSCREGVCGTCETRIVSGAVDHRDLLLTNAEKAANETMMICVSRPLSETLELDL